MKHDDPLNDMLQRAFASERAALEVPDVTGTVMRRIRRQVRRRALVFGSMGLSCVAVLELSGLDLAPMLTLWGRELTLLLHGDAILTLTLVLLGFAAIAAAETELV